MVGFQQIDTLAVVAGQVHGLWSLPVRRPLSIHGHEAVRREDSIPQHVTVRVVSGTVGCIPPESSPPRRNGIDLG